MYSAPLHSKCDRQHNFWSILHKFSLTYIWYRDWQNRCFCTYASSSPTSPISIFFIVYLCIVNAIHSIAPSARRVRMTSSPHKVRGLQPSGANQGLAKNLVLPQTQFSSSPLDVLLIDWYTEYMCKYTCIVFATVLLLVPQHNHTALEELLSSNVLMGFLGGPSLQIGWQNKGSFLSSLHNVYNVDRVKIFTDRPQSLYKEMNLPAEREWLEKERGGIIFRKLFKVGRVLWYKNMWSTSWQGSYWWVNVNFFSGTHSADSIVHLWGGYR